MKKQVERKQNIDAKRQWGEKDGGLKECKS